MTPWIRGEMKARTSWRKVKYLLCKNLVKVCFHMSKLNIILNTGTDRLTEAKAEIRVYGIGHICPERICVIIVHTLWEDSAHSMCNIIFLVKELLPSRRDIAQKKVICKVCSPFRITIF